MGPSVRSISGSSITPSNEDLCRFSCSVSVLITNFGMEGFRFGSSIMGMEIVARDLSDTKLTGARGGWMFAGF